MTEDNDPYLKVFENAVRLQGPEAAFRQLVMIFRGNEKDALRVKYAYEKKVGIIRDLPGGATLQARRFADWYSGPSDDDQYWPALKRYLLERKKWPKATVEDLDRESTNVMKRLPPVYGTVDAKGLVVGYVQSGKTANYTALIAKAADVGYRLFIVLAGVHNSLRRQTQLRLQAELIDSDEVVKQKWHTLTLPQEDFRARGTNTDAFLSSQAAGQRILLVVKKNGHVLKRLEKWLNQGQPAVLEACPALIIDDEADQAGLNTGKSDEERTAINKLILSIKKTLPKSAYVGYTATPFANVLVNPAADDLYPSDFIVALPKPPGYFGAELFFGREPLETDDEEPPGPPDMFREVPDEDVAVVRPQSATAAKGFRAQVPPSLKTAIKYFILAAAARWVRGQRLKHSSMLVHTSLNVDVQEDLHAKIVDEIGEFRNRLKLPDERAVLEKLWTEEHAKVTCDGLPKVSFKEIESRLEELLDRTRVVLDNGQSPDRLLYKDEAALTVQDHVVHIAVGGNTLSRGLTLEGLIVSYFVRTATAYDTLLQMGRWFGYRFGYEDLPRLWMTNELRSDFYALATVEEEIRNDIARYEEENVTPREFAVRIRTHPTMTVTSRLKMRHAVTVEIDYAGFTRQTTIFRERDASWLEKNWKAGVSLVEQLRTRFEKKGDSHFVARSVPVSSILAFLDEYEAHPDHLELRMEFIRKYIEKQNSRGMFTNWTVAVVTLKDGRDGSPETEFGGLRVFPVNRSKLTDGDRCESVDLGTITTQSNFGIDLEGPPGAPTVTDESDLKKNRRIQPKRPVGSDPLLLLIPINKDSRPMKQGTKGREKLEAAAHVLGIALAFPDVKRGGGGVAENYIQVKLPEPTHYMEEEDIEAEGGTEVDDG